MGDSSDSDDFLFNSPPKRTNNVALPNSASKSRIKQSRYLTKSQRKKNKRDEKWDFPSLDDYETAYEDTYEDSTTLSTLSSSTRTRSSLFSLDDGSSEDELGLFKTKEGRRKSVIMSLIPDDLEDHDSANIPLNIITNTSLSAENDDYSKMTCRQNLDDMFSDEILTTSTRASTHKSHQPPTRSNNHSNNIESSNVHSKIPLKPSANVSIIILDQDETSPISTPQAHSRSKQRHPSLTVNNSPANSGSSKHSNISGCSIGNRNSSSNSSKSSILSSNSSSSNNSDRPNRHSSIPLPLSLRPQPDAENSYNSSSLPLTPSPSSTPKSTRPSSTPKPTRTASIPTQTVLSPPEQTQISSPEQQQPLLTNTSSNTLNSPNLPCLPSANISLPHSDELNSPSSHEIVLNNPSESRLDPDYAAHRATVAAEHLDVVTTPLMMRLRRRIYLDDDGDQEDSDITKSKTKQAQEAKESESSLLSPKATKGYRSGLSLATLDHMADQIHSNPSHTAVIDSTKPVVGHLEVDPHINPFSHMQAHHTILAVNANSRKPEARKRKRSRHLQTVRRQSHLRRQSQLSSPADSHISPSLYPSLPGEEMCIEWLSSVLPTPSFTSSSTSSSMPSHHSPLSQDADIASTHHKSDPKQRVTEGLALLGCVPLHLDGSRVGLNLKNKSQHALTKREPVWDVLMFQDPSIPHSNPHTNYRSLPHSSCQTSHIPYPQSLVNSNSSAKIISSSSPSPTSPLDTSVSSRPQRPLRRILVRLNPAHTSQTTDHHPPSTLKLTVPYGDLSRSICLVNKDLVEEHLKHLNSVSNHSNNPPQLYQQTLLYHQSGDSSHTWLNTLKHSQGTIGSWHDPGGMSSETTQSEILHHAVKTTVLHLTSQSSILLRNLRLNAMEAEKDKNSDKNSDKISDKTEPNKEDKNTNKTEPGVSKGKIGENKGKTGKIGEKKKTLLQIDPSDPRIQEEIRDDLDRAFQKLFLSVLPATKETSSTYKLLETTSHDLSIDRSRDIGLSESEYSLSEYSSPTPSQSSFLIVDYIYDSVRPHSRSDSDSDVEAHTESDLDCITLDNSLEKDEPQPEIRGGTFTTPHNTEMHSDSDSDSDNESDSHSDNDSENASVSQLKPVCANVVGVCGQFFSMSPITNTTPHPTHTHDGNTHIEHIDRTTHRQYNEHTDDSPSNTNQYLCRLRQATEDVCNRSSLLTSRLHSLINLK